MKAFLRINFKNTEGNILFWKNNEGDLTVNLNEATLFQIDYNDTETLSIPHELIMHNHIDTMLVVPVKYRDMYVDAIKLMKTMGDFLRGKLKK